MAFLPPSFNPANRNRPQYKETTLRQFDGGWNVVDSQLNITPRFAPIFDNVTRAPDGSVRVRYGSKLWRDLQTGTETIVTSASGMSVETFFGAANRALQFNWPSHGLTNGQAIKFNNLPSSPLHVGFDLSSINGIVFNIRYVSSGEFEVILRTKPATLGTTVLGAGISFTKSTHLMGSRSVNGTYFADRLIVVSGSGEIIAITSDGTATRIWDNILGAALPDAPGGWGQTDFVSFNSFGSRLQVHNGRDKPLEIDFSRTPITQYLVDPADGSNAFVPIGFYATTSVGYTAIGGKVDKPAELSLSAKLASGVYAGDTEPDDAVDIDMAKVANVNDAGIRGLIELRDRLLVAYRDSVSVGKLGNIVPVTIGEETIQNHEPDFKDNIAQHGTISHRTMINLGNDVLMCDRAGVPSIAQSEQSGIFVPTRVSELIEPALQLNLSRLTEETLALRAFAVFNARDRQYMLFIPRYEPTDIRYLVEDPISLLADLGPNRFIINIIAHGFEIGDEFTIAEVDNIGLNAAGYFNGTWNVESVIDEDNIVVYNPDYDYPQLDITGGGVGITVKPNPEGYYGYVLTYNPKLRIKSWSRFKGLDFDWGCRSINGRVFFGKEGKIYQFGTSEFPFPADQMEDYDARVWTAGTPYATGYRIRDSVDGYVYEALVDHTATPVGIATFAIERSTYPDRWTRYVGRAIKFDWEWPWGDFDKRLNSKAVRAVMPDTSGSGRFTLGLFVDLLYKNPSSGALTPVREIEFVGNDAGGYGASTQPYGGGRRTKEQLYWPMPVVGKLHKFKISGETKEPLRFIAFSIVYHQGTMKR